MAESEAEARADDVSLDVGWDARVAPGVLKRVLEAGGEGGRPPAALETYAYVAVDGVERAVRCGNGELAPGLDEAVLTMRPGEVCEVLVEGAGARHRLELRRVLSHVAFLEEERRKQQLANDMAQLEEVKREREEAAARRLALEDERARQVAKNEHRLKELQEKLNRKNQPKKGKKKKKK